MHQIANEKYVALVTYKKDGSEKSLPVWICDFEDGSIGFTTASSSYKFKRLRNNPNLTLQPSDSKGNVAADAPEPVSGTAELVTGPAFEPYRDKVKAKYGIQYRMINAAGKFMKLIGKGSGTDAAVVITLD